MSDPHMLREAPGGGYTRWRTTSSGFQSVSLNFRTEAATRRLRIAIPPLADEVTDRNNHVRSADFFNVEEHKEMTFASTGLRADGGDFILEGNLTLRGVTKSVTFELTASRKGSDTIAVQGDIPITWSEWGIPEPSFGPAQVASDGEIEFLLVLTR